MKKFLKSLLLFALAFTVLAPSNVANAADSKNTTSKTIQTTNKKIITYFPNWGIYQEAHQKIQVKDIAWDKVTHIHHGFFEITNDFNIKSTDDYADFQNESFAKADWSKYPNSGYPEGQVFGHFGEYKKYKEQYPNVKVLVSVGGWTRSDKFHEVSKTAANRKTLANNMVKFMEKYPFIDGFDIDWEYPTFSRTPSDQYDRGAVGGPEDKENFTLLLKDIRETFDANNMGDKLLTVAVSAGEEKIRATEPDKYAQYVDYIGVMTYDFAGAWDSVTGHLAGIYQNPADNELRPKFNMDDAMKIFSEDYKVPKDKLLGGTPLYSRGWGNVEPGPNGDGLFQPGDGNFIGDLGTGGQYSWFQIKKMENSGGWKKFTDPISKVPYLYNASTKQFLTYEDEASLTERINYINSNGYGGLIVWDASGDDISANHPMHTIMYNGLIKGELLKLPAVATISSDKTLSKGDYTITANIPSNSKATSYKLYENEAVIKEGTVSNDALNITLPITSKSDGVYIYRIETINDSGITSSNQVSVTVSKISPKPLKASLSVDVANNTGTYNLSVNIPSNSNATSYKLYENNAVIKEGAVTSSSINFTEEIKDKTKGTYTYKVETINEDNTTFSDDLIVTVSDLSLNDNATDKPAKPSLSHNAWSNTGNYTVTMNMWWGENGSAWKLYENGKLISVKNLNYNSSKSAQSDSVEFTNKAKGTYTYKAELINSKGVTESSEITVTIN